MPLNSPISAPGKHEHDRLSTRLLWINFQTLLQGFSGHQVPWGRAPCLPPPTSPSTDERSGRFLGSLLTVDPSENGAPGAVHHLDICFSLANGYTV